MSASGSEKPARSERTRPPLDDGEGPAAANEVREADVRKLRLLEEAERIAGLGSWEWYPATDRLTWSGSLYGIFGIDPAEGVDFERYASRLHPEDRDRVLGIIQDLEDQQGRVTFQHRIVRPDGELRWLACRAEWVRGESAEGDRLVGTARDITVERRAAEREQALEEATAARDAAEEKARLVEHLQSVGMSMAAELDPDRLSQAVVDAATELTGADVGAFFYDPPGDEAREFALYAVSGGSVEALEDVLEGRTVAFWNRIFRDEGPVRIDDVTARDGQAPRMPFVGVGGDGAETRSYLAVPIVSEVGRILGGLFLGHPDTGAFGAQHEELLTELASRAAVAFENAQAYRHERQARAEAEKAAERMRFLNEVGEVLSSSLDQETLAETVARLSIPRFADWCVVDVMHGDGSVRRTELLHRNEEKEEVARRVRETFRPSQASPQPGARALRSGEPVFLPDVSERTIEEHTMNREHQGLIEELGARSVIAVPLTARDHVLGALTFVVGDSGRRYDEADLNLARELATRVGLALHNARLYRSARESRAAAERRAAEEEALRRAAEALGRGETVEEVTTRIARSAVKATGADGAVVERLTRNGWELEAVAGAAAYTLPIGVRIPFEGSLAREVIQRGEPVALERLAEAEYGVSEELKRACGECAAIAVPLSSAEEPLGALFLLRAPDQPAFGAQEVDRARIFGELSAIALRKARLLEREARRSAELQRVIDSRSRLMQAFTHDVKNPLGAAESHARLLLEEIQGDLTAEQRDSAERIVGSIESALGLIRDILELSRAEAGKIPIEPAAVDLDEVATEVVREHRAEAEAAGLELSLASGGGEHTVETDGGRVRQILENLISNAIKYTNDGGVEVVLDRRSEEPESGGPEPDRRGPGEWVVLAVRDTGPGVTEEEQEALFQEFSRVGRRDVPGTGLGLAISRSIARLLGGDITVESERGEGSTFLLWIPVEGGAGAKGE